MNMDFGWDEEDLGPPQMLGKVYFWSNMWREESLGEEGGDSPVLTRLI